MSFPSGSQLICVVTIIIKQNNNNDSPELTQRLGETQTQSTKCRLCTKYRSNIKTCVKKRDDLTGTRTQTTGLKVSRDFMGESLVEGPF